MPAPRPETEKGISRSPGSSEELRAATQVLYKIALAGISNSGAALFTNPADLVKVRQQLESVGHVKSLDSNVSSRSSRFTHVLVNMVRNEGILSMYKGLSASIIREATYSGLRMGLYDITKSTINTTVYGDSSGDNSTNYGTKLAAGMISGMTGAAIANPADLIKVRMQAPAAKAQTLRSHAYDVYKDRGIAGLYRAVFPTTIRAGILTSTQMGVYDITKHELIDRLGFQERFGTHFLASGMAGIACTLSSSPVDVIKVRLMNDQIHEFRNSLHCAAIILKREGPLAFYKGGFMCWIRLWPHTVISLSLFEKLREVAGLQAI